MNAPDLEERIAFWQHAYARSAFMDARMFCESLLSRDLGMADTLRKALTVSIVSVYSRPFKQRRPVRLSENIVPSSHRATHDSLLEIRDKVIAHRDLDAPVTEWGFISQLQINVASGEFSLDTISPVLTDSKVQQVIPLVSELIRYTDAQIDPFVRKYLQPFDPTKASCVVSLDPDPASWLVRQPR